MNKIYIRYSDRIEQRLCAYFLKALYNSIHQHIDYYTVRIIHFLQNNQQINFLFLYKKKITTAVAFIYARIIQEKRKDKKSSDSLIFVRSYNSFNSLLQCIFKNSNPFSLHIRRTLYGNKFIQHLVQSKLCSNLNHRMLTENQYN